MENEYDEKREIMKDIILDEEDVLAKLKRIVQLAKPFFKIEGNTGRVVISTVSSHTNYEKMYFVILGKYLAYHSNVLDQSNVTIRVLEDELGVKKTTLSGPLSRLVKKNLVKKPQKDTYQINPHNIEAMLKKLSKKYSVNNK